MTSLAIERFRSLSEEDRQNVLQEILSTRSWSLEPDALGILKLALDRGTSALKGNQIWRLLYGAWIPNVAVECSRHLGELQPDEMVLATAQEGRCCYCQNAWYKLQDE